MMFALVKCHICGGKASESKKITLGTSIHNTLDCAGCGHRIIDWKAQPIIGKLPAFNLLLAASIVFSGKKLTINKHIKTSRQGTSLQHRKDVI